MPLFGKKSKKSTKRSSLPIPIDDSSMLQKIYEADDSHLATSSESSGSAVKNVETASEASESSFYPDLNQDPVVQSLKPIPETVSNEPIVLVKLYTAPNLFFSLVCFGVV